MNILFIQYIEIIYIFKNYIIYFFFFVCVKRILDEWSTSAIEYTKELISASDTIYFDYLVSDQYGRYYGEFYLNIKNNIICLSEILVLNHYAVYLDKGKSIIFLCIFNI